MHRIDGPGATADDKFTEGDPVAAVPATVVTDDWLNDVQEELISILAAAGIDPVKGTQNQVLAAINSLIANSSNDLLNTTRINVASAATVNLTTSAPNTRHINITGSTAITAFTVAAGKCYFVRFAGDITLTNGASLVTQTGANIAAKAGDTCIIRATSANVVEVLSYSPLVASQIDIDAGTGDSRPVTPAKMRFGVSFSKTAAGGHLALPSWLGGFIFNFGSYAAAQTSLVFSLPFPTACAWVGASGTSTTTVSIVTARSNSGATINSGPTGTYFAFGW